MPPETQTETFEVVDQPETVVELPTHEDAKDQGLTAKEIEAAEKRGMVQKVEEKEPEKEKAPVTNEIKTEVKPEEKPAEKKPTYRGTPMDDVVLTPEQEKVFLDTFGAGTPHRAMYFRAKNERTARQRVEQERDRAETKLKELEAKFNASELAKRTQEVDEDGNVIDPEDKPLTLKQLKAMQQVEAEEYEKKKQENEQRARFVADAQTTQEEYARSIYTDFDDTVKKAAEVIKNLDSLIPEKWQQAKAVKMIRELQIAAANADKIDLDDYHAALIAYEIGKMHPDYGKPAESSTKTTDHTSDENGKPLDPKKANGSRQLTPEQMKRIEKNTQRGASSASVTGGGGKRVVSADDVDAITLNKMSYADRQRFREKHPDQYTKLLRG